MDSKVVSRELREHVWPDLRAAGFLKFTSRVAWRHRPEQIDVIEVRSFNKHNADVLGITTFSFAVSVGTCLLHIPPQWPYPVKGGVVLPSEPECQFRSPVLNINERKPDRRQIWPVTADGSNLSSCIQGLRQALPSVLGLHDALSDKEHVLDVLLEQQEDMNSMWGFGRNPSPIRAYLTGYVALSLRYDALAKQKLTEAVASKCFASNFASVEEAINRAP